MLRVSSLEEMATMRSGLLQLGLHAAQPAGGLVAVHHRHLQVEQHHVGPSLSPRRARRGR
jgi:hypothetical protein